MKPQTMREIRKKLNMTQQEFANLLFYKSYHSINEMEKEKFHLLLQAPFIN